MFHPSAADHVHGRPIRSRDRLDAEAAEDDRNLLGFSDVSSGSRN